MKKSRKAALSVALALVMALAVGSGLALAQSDSDTGTAGDGSVQNDDWAPGGPGGPGHFGRPGLMVGGEVVSVEGDIITLNTPRGDQKQVQVNGDTAYRKDGNDASLADVVAGERIGIALDGKPEEGETPLAKAIIIGAPDQQRPHPAVGEVTAVDGNNVTINTADGEKQFTLPEVQTGSRIGVLADEDGNVKGLMYDPPEWLQNAPEDAPQTNDQTSESAS